MVVPRLTKEQRDWLESVVNDFDIIYLGLYGSHVYGLSRPESDIDIKGVYLPSIQNILLGKDNTPISKKNEELNIEVELKPIGSFLNSAKACDTNVMDMLHTPSQFWISFSPLWYDFVVHRADLYAKNMKGLVGYIKTHAAKYGNKIERLSEIKELLVLTEQYSDTQRISDLCKDHSFSDYKYVESILFTGRQDMEEQPYLEVCGKKYITTWSIAELKTALNREANRYGKRSNTGLDNGLDTKSLSHALRVLIQLHEIVTEGTMTLPLKDPSYVLAVKQGQITSAEEIMNKIDSLYDECMVAIESSGLQDEPNISWFIEKTLDIYYRDY